MILIRLLKLWIEIGQCMPCMRAKRCIVVLRCHNRPNSVSESIWFSSSTCHRIMVKTHLNVFLLDLTRHLATFTPLSHWRGLLLRSFPINPIVKLALKRDKVLKKLGMTLGSVVVSRPSTGWSYLRHDMFRIIAISSRLYPVCCKFTAGYTDYKPSRSRRSDPNQVTTNQIVPRWSLAHTKILPFVINFGPRTTIRCALSTFTGVIVPIYQILPLLYSDFSPVI